MTQFLIWLYALLLHLYPHSFHAAYSQEMRSVFAETILIEPGIKPAVLFLREIFDLPASVLSVHAVQWSQGGNMPSQNEYILPSTRWQTLTGTLPFLAFGIASIIGKIDPVYAPQYTYVFLAFYNFTLLGFLIGWIRGFPLWSYSYLGWSLVFAWWWTGMSINGTNWGHRIWILFGFAVLIALIWTRSINPIKKLFHDIWNDWTRLSLSMYTFIAFVFLIYDENHHPWLLIFMSAATLAIAAGAWFFLRSANLKGRVVSILGGLAAGLVISRICESTWDWAAYYGLPEELTPWYLSVFRTVMFLSIFVVFLFWPAIIALIHRIIARRTANP